MIKIVSPYRLDKIQWSRLTNFLSGLHYEVETENKAMVENEKNNTQYATPGINIRVRITGKKE